MLIFWLVWHAMSYSFHCCTILHHRNIIYYHTLLNSQTFLDHMTLIHHQFLLYCLYIFLRGCFWYKKLLCHQTLIYHQTFSIIWIILTELFLREGSILVIFLPCLLFYPVLLHSYWNQCDLKIYIHHHFFGFKNWSMELKYHPLLWTSVTIYFYLLVWKTFDCSLRFFKITAKLICDWMYV